MNAKRILLFGFLIIPILFCFGFYGKQNSVVGDVGGIPDTCQIYTCKSITTVWELNALKVKFYGGFPDGARFGTQNIFVPGTNEYGNLIENNDTVNYNYYNSCVPTCGMSQTFWQAPQEVVLAKDAQVVYSGNLLPIPFLTCSGAKQGGGVLATNQDNQNRQNPPGYKVQNPPPPPMSSGSSN